MSLQTEGRACYCLHVSGKLEFTRKCEVAECAHRVMRRMGGKNKNCLPSCTTKTAFSFHILKNQNRVFPLNVVHTPSLLSSPLALPRLKNKVKPKTECDMRSCQAQLGSTAGGQSYVWNHRVTE